jgi:hypothetical protein
MIFGSFPRMFRIRWVTPCTKPRLVRNTRMQNRSGGLAAPVSWRWSKITMGDTYRAVYIGQVCRRGLCRSCLPEKIKTRVGDAEAGYGFNQAQVKKGGGAACGKHQNGEISPKKT